LVSDISSPPLPGGLSDSPPALGGRELVRRFWAYYAPHQRLFWLDFGSAVASGLLELGFPIAVAFFIDDLLPSNDWPAILLAALALLLVYVVNAGLKVVVNYWGHKLGINIETEMRRKSFDHVQKLSFRFFDDHKTGHLVGRLTSDLQDIGELAHHGPEELFVAVMTLVGALALMFATEPQLALIAALVVPVAGVVTVIFGARMNATWEVIYARIGDFNARIEGTVGGIRVVQAFANEDHERRLFARDNAAYRATKLQAYKALTVSETVSYLSMRLAKLVVMVAGAWFVLQGELSAGGFVGFLLLAAVFFQPIEAIGFALELYPKGIAGFRRYQQLLAIAPEVVDRPRARELVVEPGAIRYEGVDFGYAADRPILRGFDLAIEPGETVAFVGPSGAGKTTICALLPRFYDVTGGRITIDGVDVRDATLTSLRAAIGIVQQDVFLFDASIRENIAYGKLGASDEEIRAAARRAELDGLIDDLPDGLDTRIGERGVRLSGGQKQRLSIARMFLKNPPILILDEATSALDSETERAIQASLRELAVGRTTLVIAHRLATVRHADRIVVVDGAGVAEHGRHEDLLGRHGLYRRLHEAQFAGTTG
jgi:ATP-binding cassette subfamily B protein